MCVCSRPKAALVDSFRTAGSALRQPIQRCIGGFVASTAE